MKIKNKLAILLLLLIPQLSNAQSLHDILGQIEHNNLSLKALRQEVAAEQLGNRVGLAPANPEVEFAYLWGSPTSMGNRIDFSVTQSFDFPSAYVHRGKMADLKNEQANIEYQKNQRLLYLEVGELYYEILYQNVRIHDMEKCLAHLQKISQAYQNKLDAGKINIFDYNKIKLEELNLQQEKAHAEAKRDGLLLQMKQLNGGQAIAIDEEAFPPFALPENFDVWYARIVEQAPEIQQWTKAQEINQQQLKLQRSLWAPQFFAGYMREHVPGELFHGIKAGISLPLWQNAHTLKQTKLQSSALNLMLTDEKMKFRNDLENHYQMVQSLQKQIADYQALLLSVEETDLLDKALNAGEISLIEYLLELSMYHESHERFAELQHDIALQYVHLQIVER